AAEMRELLRQFDHLYKPTLDAISEITREEWLAGTPTTSPAAFHASACYAQIENGLHAIRDLRAVLECTLGNARTFNKGEFRGGYTAEVERLIGVAARVWTQENEIEWVWAITRLQTATPDAITQLQLGVRGVAGAAARLKDMKSPANVGG